MTTTRTARGLAASGIRDGQADNSGEDSSTTNRTPVKLILIGVFVLFCIIVLAGLGFWQLERRAWKLDLINRVEQRIHEPAAGAPGPDQWTGINDSELAYRHIETSGRFLDKPVTLVKAVTSRGSGYWVMSPFQSSSGFTVLINRGFVPADRANEGWQPDQLQTNITGLLRITEPGGGFLRSNDPAGGRWYSRDVASIAATLNIESIAPYFIDAGAGQNPVDLPAGGLTVIAFPNNHLVYALTWFGMALMLGVASTIVGRNEWRARRGTETRSRSK
jgi:surfeit locus 1 family protein